METPIVYVDRSEIKAGTLDKVRVAISELVSFIESQEPQLLAYGFYINAGGTGMAVVAVHPDSASLARHLAVGGPLFRAVGEFIDLQSIDVFGEVTDQVLEQLQQKARMLGTSARVSVHPLAQGFSRLQST